jgi:hypothetical protein
VNILEEANEIIHGQRREDYGGPLESFTKIGNYWSNYLGIPVSPHDVANLMILLKVARAQNGFHRDSYVDIGGYAGCTELIEEEQNLEPHPVKAVITNALGKNTCGECGQEVTQQEFETEGNKTFEWWHK